MSKDTRLPLWQDRSIDEKLDALRQLVEGLYGYILRDDLRAIIELLDGHIPLDDTEAGHLKTIKQWVSQNPMIVSRGFEPAHLVGSGLVLDLDSGRVLLHFHPKLGKWLQFGGHARYETDFSQVAMREALEESGLSDLQFFPDKDKPSLIDVDVHTIPERNQVPDHLHLDLRFLLSTREPDRVFEKEAAERRELPPGVVARRFRWFTCDEAINEPMLMDNVRRLIQKTKIEYEKYSVSSS